MAVAEIRNPRREGVSRDLVALRKQLERDEPDSERVAALLHRLGEATRKIAEKADKQGDKLRELGEALVETGDPQADEEEDTEAKASPKRRSPGGPTIDSKGQEKKAA